VVDAEPEAHPVSIGGCIGGRGRAGRAGLPYWCGTPWVAELRLISRNDIAPLFFSAIKWTKLRSKSNRPKTHIMGGTFFRDEVPHFSQAPEAFGPGG
jgi:hypothetical protein